VSIRLKRRGTIWLVSTKFKSQNLLFEAVIMHIKLALLTRSQQRKQRKTGSGARNAGIGLPFYHLLKTIGAI